ncbi:hypothetical protein [Nocardia africana]|uniref:Uncharacterized protein n=1 Tax=Nocardia africana TaxID=134964 RepID=A0A378WXH5_9NOCA|nr:hypothetical protein [Nocardia africana]MCC3313089.1 hypothetical protein [Nocardia africana]SUA45562.1 Uncharacterised protein [Nocardia africana]
MAGITLGDGVGRSHVLLAASAGVVTASVVALGVALSVGLPVSAPLGSAPAGNGVAAGAVAFALVVGIPMTITAGGALAGDRRVATAAVTSGLLLICWLLAEMAVVRTLDWAQPLYLVLGIVVAGLGLHIKTEEIAS